MTTPPGCHSEPFTVILSEAKDLALGAQGKLREVRILDSDGVHRTPEIGESRPEYAQGTARFLVAFGSSE